MTGFNHQDYKLEIEVELIHESGKYFIFPVRIYKGNDLLLLKSIQIRASFYCDLKKTQGWKQALNKIFVMRSKDDLIALGQPGNIPIEDKLDLLEG